MKFFLPFCCFVMLSSIVGAQKPEELAQAMHDKRVRLPNGWHLSPAGSSLPLGDLPLNLALSRSQKWLAVTNNGQSVQSIQLINTRQEKVVDNVVIAKSWYGLKFSADEKFLYASGGNDNRILQYAINNDKLILQDSIVLGKPWPVKISPAGIEIDDAAQLMYVVTKENNVLYIINMTTKSILQQIPLDKEAYTCLLSPDKKNCTSPCGAAIKCWYSTPGKERSPPKLP
ncbi:hypothetical protein [Paraflavitalea speifideaquila]|uniref:YncE family protein n=1 Tax=Paraflavitalea speifideaquila TaxID=3076558 RepID=UPI0028EE1CE8|nr:hypothetical protein [Paraflavitalea speifideiaquila]